jgi:hypothetical protein
MDGTKFAEPCAGDGQLVSHLEAGGLFKCQYSGDIASGADALQWSCPSDVDFICTNPPWDRPIMHRLAEHFISFGKPVWLLIDADWMHTKQASYFMDLWCTHIISIGRVRWIEGTTMDGYDNSAWYRFLDGKQEDTKFLARRP